METIKEAKDYLKENWLKGVDCPCCTQRVQLYKWKLHSQMAQALVIFFRIHRENGCNNNGWIHVPSEFTKRNINHSNTSFAKLKHWALVEERPIEEQEKEDKEKKSSGWWGITHRGIQFAKNELRIPKHAFIFNSKAYHPTNPVETISVIDALGNKFNYSELIGDGTGSL